MTATGERAMARLIRLSFAALWAFGLVVAMANVAGVAGAQSSCIDPRNQRDAVNCAEAAWRLADRELNTIWPTIRSVVADTDDRIDPSSKRWSRTVLNAQRAWITFRDANCEAARFMYAGGTNEALAYWACMERMTRERINELNLLVENFR
jgi:uncharacterized protein YecT (DUF1311 family)